MMTIFRCEIIEKFGDQLDDQIWDGAGEDLIRRC
jgi:hypothetical protein